jgi:hypothetical protein
MSIIGSATEHIYGGLLALSVLNHCKALWLRLRVFNPAQALGGTELFQEFPSSTSQMYRDGGSHPRFGGIYFSISSLATGLIIKNTIQIRRQFKRSILTSMREKLQRYLLLHTVSNRCLGNTPALSLLYSDILLCSVVMHKHQQYFIIIKSTIFNLSLSLALRCCMLRLNRTSYPHIRPTSDRNAK